MVFLLAGFCFCLLWYCAVTYADLWFCLVSILGLVILTFWDCWVLIDGFLWCFELSERCGLCCWFGCVWYLVTSVSVEGLIWGWNQFSSGFGIVWIARVMVPIHVYSLYELFLIFRSYASEVRSGMSCGCTGRLVWALLELFVGSALIGLKWTMLLWMKFWVCSRFIARS